MWQGSIKKVVETNDSACKGCGCCQATCPKNGILIYGFTLEEIEAQQGYKPKIAAINALGSWAQVASFTIGSSNTPAAPNNKASS